MARLLDKYTKDIVPALGKKLNRTNVLSLPRIKTIQRQRELVKQPKENKSAANG